MNYPETRTIILAADGRYEVREATDDGVRVLARCRTMKRAENLAHQQERETRRLAGQRQVARDDSDYYVAIDQGDHLELRGGYDWGRGEATYMSRNEAEWWANHLASLGAKVRRR